MAAPIESVSKHFTLETLGEGIFAAIAINGGQAICNAGLVDLGGLILVYDPFLTPQAASDLRKFAVEEFGQFPQIIINSHYHNDHIWGNQVFSGESIILSSTLTRDSIATSGLEELEWNKANASKRYEALLAQYQSSHDPTLLLWIGEYGGIIEALPTLQVCLPKVTFSDRLDFHGTKHMAQLLTFEGHTSSDTILVLTEDRIAFISDLLFVGCHPYLGDGDPLKLVASLREISQLGVECFVPGHGPVGTRADLETLVEYIEHCLITAEDLVRTGQFDQHRFTELTIPDRYAGWLVPEFYGSNLRFLGTRLTSGN